MNSSTGKRASCSSFYLDAGADALVGEEPVDRMADEAPPPAPAAVRPPPQQRQARTERCADIIPAGRTARRRTPPSWRRAKPPRPRRTSTTCALSSKISTGCPLRNTATQIVFADGNPQARVMFVGEAPGYEEDISGRPFVGRSGKLLDRMIEAIGLDRTTAYIANVVPWRPPGNRTPTPQETAICLPFIRRQIELANPDILVCLGGPSAQTLLGIKDGITRTRGRWFPYDTGKREIRAMATFHPAFLLRSPLQKRLAWRDFLAIKKALAQ